MSVCVCLAESYPSVRRTQTHTHIRAHDSTTTDNYLNAHMFNCGISNSQSTKQLPAGTHCFGTRWALFMCVYACVCACLCICVWCQLSRGILWFKTVSLSHPPFTELLTFHKSAGQWLDMNCDRYLNVFTVNDRVEYKYCVFEFWAAVCWMTVVEP